MSFATLTGLAQEGLSAKWRVNVNGQVYGPYTGYQLKEFAQEGRIAPHSIVQAGETGQGPWITAIDDPVLGQLFVKPMFERDQKQSAAADGGFANLVIVADVKSRGTGQFETKLAELGEYYRLNAQVWLLHTDRTVGTVRNVLAPQLGGLDTLFIADASRGGKTAWFNLGPEADSKIRKVWRRTAEKAAI